MFDEDKIKSLFRYDHLPPHLQEISKPFHDLALDLHRKIFISTPELTLAFRALWEAKNLAVFAMVESKDEFK